MTDYLNFHTSTGVSEPNQKKTLTSPKKGFGK